VPAREYITLFDILALCSTIESPKPALEFVKNIARMQPQFFFDSIWPLLSGIEMELTWAKMMKAGEAKARPVVCTYLMRDNRNGLIKIGKSITPGKREKTLQSEEPEIVMFAFLEQNIESLLHKRYKQHRVRGEWFSLTTTQIEELFLEYPFTQLRPAKRNEKHNKNPRL
jgi:hypothetical protein